MFRNPAKVAVIMAAAFAVLIFDPSPADAHAKGQKVTKLMKAPLSDAAGKIARMARFEVGPGWISKRHTHPGDLFVYVTKGELTIIVDGEDPREIGPGQVFHEKPNKPMTAQNLNSEKGATFIIFQVGKAGEPLMVPVK